MAGFLIPSHCHPCFVCFFYGLMYVHCVLRGSSLYTFSILAQGLSFVRLKFFVVVSSDKSLLWDISGMHLHWFVCSNCVYFMSYMYFQSFISFDSWTPGVPGRHGWSDDLGVIARTTDYCTSPHCQRVVPSIPYPFIFSIICTTEYPPDLENPSGSTAPHTWLLW